MPRTGRPRKNTPEELAKAVDQLIERHEKARNESRYLDDLPQDRDLMVILGIMPATLERYYEGYFDRRDEEKLEDTLREDSERLTYEGILKKLIAYRTSICVEGLLRSGKGEATKWIFLLKQPHWGGFQDVQRVERSGNLGVQISLTGPDGKPIKNA